MSGAIFALVRYNGEVRCYEHRTSLLAQGANMTPSTIVPQRQLLYKTSTGTSTYISWRNMLARTKPNHANAHRYYLRGIRVCDRWMNFDNFVEDMGLRPEGKTIDRIDNDKGYEPGNCQWSNQKDQCSNKENCRLITIDGETHTLKEWDRVRGFRPNVVWYRLARGWCESDAVLTPLKNSRWHK